MSITSLEINTRALGNAAFIYATLFGIGKKLNLPIKIPFGENHVHQPTGQHIIQLKEIFNISIPNITQDEIDSIKYTFTEKHKGFNKEIFDIQDNTNIIGFFQSSKYFDHCKEELLQELTFGNRILYQAMKKFSDLGVNPNECISLHIRRGDYTKPHLQIFHPVLSLDYYQAAIQYIMHWSYKSLPVNRIPKNVLVFSDDIEYCKKIFNQENIIVIDNSEYNEFCAPVDLCMMSLCRMSILANSSFSWWGAYLGNKKDLVIYPSVWFGPGYQNFNIVDVKEWIKI